jgi:hypothetical protein
MDISAIVECVFACVGAVSTAATAIGAVLPATSSFGKWCRTVGVDLKDLLGAESTVEDVAKLAEKK